MLVWRVLCVLSLFPETTTSGDQKYYPHIDNSSTKQLRRLEEVTVASFRHLTEGVVTKFVTRQFVPS